MTSTTTAIPATAPLPPEATLADLRTLAKDLRLAVRAGKPGVRERAGLTDPAAAAAFGIRDAQHVIAREHGFVRWQDVVSTFGLRAPRGHDLHRWFAIELNNALGDLLFDLGPDTPRLDQDRALYQAYAACYHWLEAGTPANQARAEYSIAQTALAIGRPEIAARHAPRYAELIEQHPELFSDWDHAFATEVRARLAAAQSDPDAAILKARAQELTDQIAEPPAREVVQDRLERGPWFGLN